MARLATSTSSDSWVGDVAVSNSVETPDAEICTMSSKSDKEREALFMKSGSVRYASEGTKFAVMAFFGRGLRRLGISNKWLRRGGQRERST